MVTYFRGVLTEVQKVTWPTREEARRLTLIVLAVSIMASLFLGGIDLFYGWWFQQGFDSTETFLVIALPVALIAGAAAWYFVLREPTNTER
ncbi:MAG: preprotein translocase subunit SecE [Anaerolineae bacterium]|nr:preprotein translocase subunit SecE [Anaerolineae bacterium]